MIAFTIINSVPVNLNYQLHFAREKKREIAGLQICGPHDRYPWSNHHGQMVTAVVLEIERGEAITNGDSRNIFTSVDGAWFCDAFDSLLGMV